MSKISVNSLLGLPRMVVIRDYSGIPRPQSGPPLSIHAGDVIELMFADVNSSWWQVRVTQLILVLSQHLWRYEKNNMLRLTWLARCTQCLRTACHRFESVLTPLSKTGCRAIKHINGATSTVYLHLAFIVYKSLIVLWLFITFCVLSGDS